MTRAVAGAVLGVLLLLAPGCGGGDEEEPPPVGLRAAAGAPAPGAAEVFERFVAASRRYDTAEMWGLLSAPTQAAFGGTLTRFRRDGAWQLRKASGRFSGEVELVLARAFGPRWAVATVVGEVVRDGEREPAAWGAALRREPAGWRIELDGIFFVGHRPGPLEELRAGDAELRATAQSSGRIERMVAWLDGEPVGARAVRAQPFTGTITARSGETLPPGVHVVTVFAATADTAAAQAWPFVVEEP